jgi:phosphatidylserine decarboxylase
MPRYTILGLAREGWPIIAGVVVACALVAAGGWWVNSWLGLPLAIAGIIIILWAFWFFRDPERITPREQGAIICGADGVVCFIGPGTPPPESGVTGDAASGMTRISIFMNIFNVHVNRAPVAGAVERIAYKPGRFFNASLDKASEQNERLSLVIRRPERDGGGVFVVVQIAGLIARRIVCRVKDGATLNAGERFGMIRFGSRVDHYLPPGVKSSVAIGDAVVSGVTILGREAIATTTHEPKQSAPAFQGVAR